MPGFDPQRVILGRTGLSVCRLGLASSFGLSASDVERAVDHGINYLYWGTLRRWAFGQAIRRLAKKRREDLVIVVQTYARVPALLGPSVEIALRRLGIDHCDLLLLGWWNQPPPRPILDAALAVKAAGKASHLMISGHDRTTFPRYIADETYGAVMVRYNAAHPGAEREVFPHLGERRPGVVSYTATRWGHLLDRNRIPPGEPVPRASDCYRFVLSNPAIDVGLTAPANRAELDEALTALDRGPLTPEEDAWMRRVGKAVHATGGGSPRVTALDILDRLGGIGQDRN
jgi:aryl-alcohol dehydrogenase-like predicted oxidoreductase